MDIIAAVVYAGAAEQTGLGNHAEHGVYPLFSPSEMKQTALVGRKLELIKGGGSRCGLAALSVERGIVKSDADYRRQNVIVVYNRLRY